VALPQFLTDPVLLAVLAGLLALGLWFQRGVKFDRYQRIHRLKKRFFPKLNFLWPHFVHRKGTISTDAEYHASWQISLREAFDLLRNAGAIPHLICSLKKRATGKMSGKQYEYSDLHFVWTHTDGSQTEVYIFAHKDGLDVYAHNEAVIWEMKKHLEGEQIDGDPKDVVPKAA